jgi:uncharacterized membrane protein
MLIYIHILVYCQLILKEQLVVRKDVDGNEQERLSNITLRHTELK